MRVAYLNMTDQSSKCPVGFIPKTPNNKRFCTRDINTVGCRPFGLASSEVCGYVRGYTFGTPDGFVIFQSRAGNNNGVPNLLTYGATLMEYRRQKPYQHTQ